MVSPNGDRTQNLLRTILIELTHNLFFKSEIFRSLYSHTLLILPDSKSKSQLLHQQK